MRLGRSITAYVCVSYSDDFTSTNANANKAGNTMLDCVCNGHPPSSKVDTITFAEAAPGVAALVSPATVQTIVAVGDAGAAAVDMVSSNVPENELAADTVTFDGLMLEQDGAPAVTLKAAKRKPETETSFIEAELISGVTTNDTVKIARLEAAT